LALSSAASSSPLLFSSSRAAGSAVASSAGSGTSASGAAAVCSGSAVGSTLGGVNSKNLHKTHNLQRMATNHHALVKKLFCKVELE